MFGASAIALDTYWGQNKNKFQRIFMRRIFRVSQQNRTNELKSILVHRLLIPAQARDKNKFI